MRAAIYIRVSTTMQEDNYSLGTQEEACRAYADEHGYSVVGVYRDIYSGADLWTRPQLTAMRESARAGAIDAIIAYDPDRLSRSQVHFAVLLDECERYEIELAFVSGPLDNTATGRFLTNVRAFMAETEREKFRERSMRGIIARAQSGKLRPGNRPLYGYQWADEDKSKYVIDPDKAEVVRRLFTGIASGETLRGLADKLSAEGIPTANGGLRWSHSVIRTMLTHPAYKGVARTNHEARTKVGGKQKRSARPESEHILMPEGTIPPIVTADLWDTVQVRLERNRAEATRNNRDPESFLLRSGFVVCGYCGKPARAVWVADCPKQPTRSYYRVDRSTCVHHDCPSAAMKATALDDAVWDKVRSVIMQPEIVEAELAKLRVDDPTESDLIGIERTIAAVQRQRANLTRSLALLDDDDAAAPIIAELNTLASRAKELDAERVMTLERQEGWQSAQDRITNLSAWLSSVADNLNDLTYQHKRDLLTALDVRVRLFRNDHTPRYEITASLPLDSAESGDFVSQRHAGSYQLPSVLPAFGRPEPLSPRGASPPSGRIPAGE